MQFSKKVKDKILRLKELSSQATDNLFERIKLVHQLVNEQEFIAFHNGDVLEAREALCAEYFKELHGAVDLLVLIDVYNTHSTKKWWSERKYNIKVILNEYRSAYKLKESTKENKSLKRTNIPGDLKKENDRLKKENKELKKENANLQKRLNSYEGKVA
jgi:FtsZ-binding cell division protein ZapB